MSKVLILILFLVRNAASTLPLVLTLIITPIVLFKIPFIISIIFIKNITFALGV
jgi:hypothetical protein